MIRGYYLFLYLIATVFLHPLYTKYQPVDFSNIKSISIHSTPISAMYNTPQSLGDRIANGVPESYITTNIYDVASISELYQAVKYNLLEPIDHPWDEEWLWRLHSHIFVDFIGEDFTNYYSLDYNFFSTNSSHNITKEMYKSILKYIPQKHSKEIRDDIRIRKTRFKNSELNPSNWPLIQNAMKEAIEKSFENIATEKYRGNFPDERGRNKLPFPKEKAEYTNLIGFSTHFGNRVFYFTTGEEASLVIAVEVDVYKIKVVRVYNVDKRVIEE